MAKILIVDDEEKMLVLYRDILSNAGFDILTANNANEGLRLVAEAHPDLVLLDVMMPEKDGGSIAAEMLQNNKTKEIPVIFLSSIVTDEEVSRSGGKIGGRLYVSKSTDKKELLRVIREVLAAGLNRAPQKDGRG